jgi:hypothetical protein
LTSQKSLTKNMDDGQEGVVRATKFKLNYEHT